eukprot:COSAG02_NODE_2314_length_9156_cov_8.075072_5_plen_115_part_00
MHRCRLDAFTVWQINALCQQGEPYGAYRAYRAYSPKALKPKRHRLQGSLPTAYKLPVLASWTVTVELLIDNGNGTTVVAPLPAATLTCLPFTWNVPLPPSVTAMEVAFESTETV